MRNMRNNYYSPGSILEIDSSKLLVSQADEYHKASLEEELSYDNLLNRDGEDDDFILGDDKPIEPIKKVIAIIVGEFGEHSDYKIILCNGLVETYHVTELEIIFGKKINVLPIFEYVYESNYKVEEDFRNGLFDCYIEAHFQSVKFMSTSR